MPEVAGLLDVGTCQGALLDAASSVNYSERAPSTDLKDYFQSPISARRATRLAFSSRHIRSASSRANRPASHSAAHLPWCSASGPARLARSGGPTGR